MVSIASCAPWKSGRPSAITSMRRSSMWSGRAMSRSRTRTFAETRPPASRHTLAAALSKAKPRRPNTPTVAHDARWWPRTSRGRPHRHVREVGGKGSHKRRRRSTKDLSVETRVEKSGTTRERQTCHGTSLRPQHDPVLVRQLRPHGRGQEEIFQFLSSFATATRAWANLALHLRADLHLVSRPLPTRPNWEGGSQHPRVCHAPGPVQTSDETVDLASSRSRSSPQPTDFACGSSPTRQPNWRRRQQVYL